MLKINFFEEFPDENSLSKVSLIDFPSLIFIAARSYSEFIKFSAMAKNFNPHIGIAYWPILEKSYWISPFSFQEELIHLYDDLRNNRQKEKLSILLDLELPLLNKKLFIRNLFHFARNKKVIRKIFSDATLLNIDILTAEYPLSSRILNRILRFLGISYPVLVYPHKRIVMFYTSMIRKKSVHNHILKHIIRQSHEMGDNYHVGLGCLDTGIFGNEPLITAENLHRDLSFLEDAGVKTATLFQLSGLNDSYLNVIRKFAFKN